MPIKTLVDRPNRTVLGVCSGTVTLDDLSAFVGDIVRERLFSYAKLIEAADATPRFTARELQVLIQVLGDLRGDAERGPVAIVADPERGEFARFFVDLESGARATEVFRGIHEARRWLRARALVR
jgi:hypothetical protein